MSFSFSPYLTFSFLSCPLLLWWCWSEVLLSLNPEYSLSTQLQLYPFYPSIHLSLISLLCSILVNTLLPSSLWNFTKGPTTLAAYNSHVYSTIARNNPLNICRGLIELFGQYQLVNDLSDRCSSGFHISHWCLFSVQSRNNRTIRRNANFISKPEIKRITKKHWVLSCRLGTKSLILIY